MNQNRNIVTSTLKRAKVKINNLSRRSDRFLWCLVSQARCVYVCGHVWKIPLIDVKRVLVSQDAQSHAVFRCELLPRLTAPPLEQRSWPAGAVQSIVWKGGSTLWDQCKGNSCTLRTHIHANYSFSLKSNHKILDKFGKEFAKLRKLILHVLRWPRLLRPSQTIIK